jgi:uncharacterized RDD family membrane protein YckC
MSLVPAPAHVGQPPAPAPAPRYVGLATRAISFVIDAAVINVVALIVSVGAALILSLLHIPSGLKPVLAAIGGVAYILWAAGYFVALWSTTGQTFGARVMQIRVLTSGGAVLKPRAALLRCGATLLAALPLFAGFVPVLFDDQRRAFQDRVARTVVVVTDQQSMVAGRRDRMRARYQDAKGLPEPPGSGAVVD